MFQTVRWVGVKITSTLWYGSLLVPRSGGMEINMNSKNICKFVQPGIPLGLELKDFVLETDPATMAEAHVLGTYAMILCVRGEGSFFFDGAEIAVSTGTLAFGFEGERFRAVLSADGEYVYIRFMGVRADDLLRRFDVTPQKRIFVGFEGLIPLWRESLSRADEQNVDLAAESMLLYAFSRLNTGNGAVTGPVKQVLDVIEESFTDPELSLSDVAERLGYNSKYLSHAFKEKMGVGYAEYLRDVRIKYAISLFDHGIVSVKNVSLLSGFGDPLYFSSVFKKQVGLSPTEYLEGASKRNGES